MKKQFALALVTGLLLAPLLFRMAFPTLYLTALATYSQLGAWLGILLDILWMWLILFVIMLAARLIRWVRNRE